MRVFLRLGDRLVVAGAAFQQHLLQGQEVIRRERLIAAQPLQGKVILMRLQVGGRLRPEAVHVDARREGGQVDRYRVGQLILDVDVDGVFADLVEELQQPAQSASGAVALPAQAIVDEPEVPLELMPRARTAKPAPEDVVSTLPVTTAEQGIESEPTTRVEPSASRTAEVEVATELETPSVAVAETSLVMPTSVIAEVAAPTEQVANTLTDNLTLRYTDNCWTQIRDATGKRLAFGVIKAGEVLELSGIAPFDVTLGQSDGVTVEFNGRPFEHTRFSRGKIARFQIAEDSATAE